MLSSDIPDKIPLPFADSGTKNAIPTASQIGITPGAASLTDGFPPLTFTPVSAGGIPPSGADFNGIFNMITAIQQWQSAGGIFKYDSAFSAEIGGYPKGAVLMSDDNASKFISLIDNNTDDPNSGTSVNWSLLASATIGRMQKFTSNGTFSVPAGVSTIYVSGCAAGGGGGAGGGNSSSSSLIGSGGAGGGAGQSIIRAAYSVTPGDSIPITIGGGGSGGAGVSGATGGSGGAGGNTVIGTLVTLTGGSGGAGGLSGPSSSNVAGPAGGAGYPRGGHANDTTLNNSSGSGGYGASCPFGGGGSNGRGATTNGANASPGYGYGAGGGGGGGTYAQAVTSAGGNGSSGMPGIVIIEW
jgi:hypothetical protein